MRKYIHVSLSVLLLAAAGCDGLFGGSSSGAATNQDAGPTCDKDWQALSELLAQPQACTTSASCPTGSHCADGACDWQCYSDSDCGSGNTCSCDGLCTDGTDPDPGDTADPSCPRNLDLLADSAVLERECMVDEQCPYGARCDADTGTCAFDCLPGQCDPGLECDCRGQCVAPGAAADPVEQFGYRLDVSSSSINLAAFAGTDPEIELTLTAGTEDLAFAATQPVLRLRGSDGVELTVISAGGSTLVAGVREADVSTWAFVPSGAAWRATVKVRAHVLTTWANDYESIRITGRVERGNRQIAIYDEPIPATGQWAGTVTIETGQEMETEVPVVAWGDPSSLVLFDDWRRLSESGFVSLSPVGGTVQLALVDEGPNWKRPVVLAHQEQQVEPGAVSGRVAVKLNEVVTGYTLRYQLRETTLPATCGPCGGGEVCAAGQCRAIPAPPTDYAWNLSSEWLDAWWTPATWLESHWAGIQDTDFAEKLFCARPGVGGLGSLVAVDQGQMQFPGTVTPPSGSPPTSSVTPVAGELRCDDGEVPTALAFNVQRDIANDGDSEAVTQLSLMLEECLEGLSVEPPAGAPTWSTWQSDNRCVAVNQVMPSLLWLAHGGLAQGDRPVSKRAVLMLQRILSQWIALHSFVGRETREEVDLARALGTDAPDFDDVIAELGDAWHVVLDSTVRDAVYHGTKDVLAMPDYRVPPLPVAYWTFDADDRSGNIAIDRAGDADLVLPGTVQQEVDWVRSSQRSEVPLDLGPNTLHGDVTVTWTSELSGVANPSSGYYPVVRLGNSSNKSLEVGLKVESGFPTYGVKLYARHGSGSINELRASASESRRHYAVVRDAASKRYELYVNGTLVNEGNYADAPAAGLEQGIVTVIGRLDELAVYDVALGADQISELSGRGTSGKPYDERVLELPDSGDGEQKLGLPVALLEGVAEYLRTVEHWTELRHAEIYAECGSATTPARDATTAAVGSAYRMAALARHFADSVYRQAAQPHGWEDRYAAALEDLAAAETSISATADRIGRCDDPMGLPNGALPLYFGDAATDNGRFFAASDYLVEHWAGPATDRVDAQLARARDAWLAARSSAIQEVLTGQERERRLEQIESAAGAELIRICGLEGVDPIDVLPRFRAGQLNAGNCYLAPGCSPSSTSSQCLRGELGQLALTLEGARVDAVVARSSFDDSGERLRIQNQHCAKEAEVNGALIEEIESYERDMRNYRQWSNMVSFGLGALSPNPLNAVGAWWDSFSMIEGINPETRRMEFENDWREAELARQNRACYHEYRMMSVGLGTQGRQIERALVQIQAAAIAMKDRQRRVRQIVVETNAAIQREQNRDVPSLAHHYWVDEKVDRYRSDFAWAQRLTYLALVAAEYELQVSFPEREMVVGATNPGQLADAIRAIDERRATRTINGRRPTESSVVLSVRDDILHLGSLASAGDGERAWAARKRFGELLASPAFAVRDEYGAYMGQGIPFDLEPQGALELRCAERLWRIGATIQGDIVDADAPGAYVVVRKRNSFESQWCEGHGDGSDDQVGTVEPTGRLFSSVDATADQAPNPYSSALLYPWFNVPRSQFYQSGYVEGSSEELAGRGAYGQYILLFPEYGMLDFTSQEPGDRFDLSRVEDVLIRFDLLSVDDIQGF